MNDYTNDFGFTAVDQDELKTKTGEDASLGKEVAEKLEAVAKSSAGQANSAQIEELDSKIDMLSKLVSKSLNELDDHKENLTSIDSKKELDFKDRLIECEKLILPLLQNLMKNEDKKLQDNLKPLVHFLYNLYYGKSYTFNISNPW